MLMSNLLTPSLFYGVIRRRFVSTPWVILELVKYLRIVGRSSWRYIPLCGHIFQTVYLHYLYLQASIRYLRQFCLSLSAKKRVCVIVFSRCLPVMFIYVCVEIFSGVTGIKLFSRHCLKKTDGLCVIMKLYSTIPHYSGNKSLKHFIHHIRSA